MANGLWSLPFISTPFWANRYVPCSVALEHFAPAAFSSLANPLPTASTPTRPTTPNTTNSAARYLFMRSVPPCFIGPHVTSATYTCERGGCITQLQYLSQVLLANFVVLRYGEVRLCPWPGGPTSGEAIIQPKGIIGVLCIHDRVPSWPLHKKSCRIGPGLCGTSEKSQKAKFAEFLFHALK